MTVTPNENATMETALPGWAAMTEAMKCWTIGVLQPWSMFGPAFSVWLLAWGSSTVS